MLCNNYDAVMILSDFNFELGNYYYYYLFITPLRQAVKYKHTEHININIMHDKNLQNKTTKTTKTTTTHSMMP